MAFSASAQSVSTIYSIHTFAGSDNNGDGGPAQSAFFSVLEGVCADSAGNVFLADADDNRIRKIDPSGVITTYAGTGAPSFGGDGGLATQAFLNAPYGIRVDGAGNLFIADLGNGRIREVTTKGVISTIVSGLSEPRDVAFDSAGNLYVSEFAGNRVSFVGLDGSIQLIAGVGTAGYSGDGRRAVQAELNSPAGIAFDPSGNLYIADSGNQQIRRVTPDGIITTIEGSGAPANSGAAVPLGSPTGLATDSAGNLYIVNALIPFVREMTTDGVFHGLTGEGLDIFATADGDLLIAGEQHLEELDSAGDLTQTAGASSHSFGDGAAAVNARFESVSSVVFDSKRNLVIADPVFRRLRAVAPNGTISSLQASDYMTQPEALAVDPAGRLFVADGGAIKVANPTTAATVFVANLNQPRGMAFDSAGNLYFTDSGSLFSVNSAASISSLAQQLNSEPAGVTVDPTGAVYVADSGSNVITRIAPGGSLSAVAGSGIAGFSGDGGPATAAQLNFPMGVAFDPAGNLWIADAGNNRIRYVTPSGIIQTAAGNGIAGFSGDGGNGNFAELSSPTALVSDLQGNMYVADSGNRRVRLLTPGPASTSNTAGTVTLTNAATFSPDPIVGGEIVSLFGENLGPASPLGAKIDSTGKVATQLGGTTVLFNNVPAPLYYVGALQINAQVPVEVAGRIAALVEVQRNGVTQATANVDVAAYDPGLFAVTSRAAALNQDLTVNSPSHPAAQGSIIVLYGTGFGTTQPSEVTGVPAQPPLGLPMAFVTVTIGGLPAKVLFAGDAPGYVGLTQINVRLPQSVTGQAQVVVGAGDASSPAGIFVSVQ